MIDASFVLQTVGRAVALQRTCSPRSLRKRQHRIDRDWCLICAWLANTNNLPSRILQHLYAI